MANTIIFKNKLFHSGETVRVLYKLIEKEKVAGKAKREVKEEVRERYQAFEGIIIAIKGSPGQRTFTVRRIGLAKIAIERIFPVDSPWIKDIESVRRGKVRRAKLYYIRTKKGKEAEKLKELVSAKQPLKRVKKSAGKNKMKKNEKSAPKKPSTIRKAGTK